MIPSSETTEVHLYRLYNKDVSEWKKQMLL